MNPDANPTPDTCPRVAGAERRGAPVFLPVYGRAVYTIRDEALGELTRVGLCVLCRAAMYKDYSGGLWHATAAGMVSIPVDSPAAG